MRGLHVRWPAAAAAAALFAAAGAGAAYLVMAPRGGTPQGGQPPPGAAAAPRPAAPARPAGTGARPDIPLTLTEEAVARARLTLVPATTGPAAAELRLAAVVEADQYRQVQVRSLAAGRLTEVLVRLGDRVRRGQPLARVFSQEVAEAGTRYISARADLDAHDRELQRTEKLVQIGAASRQELERAHAEHTARLAGLESARSQLVLLGLGPRAIERLAPGTRPDAAVDLPAPMDGIVTERQANPGQTVDPAAALFTVTDLSRVWVVADLYEQDFGRVRAGDEVTVALAAYPGETLPGRVAWIDPQLRAETRSARVRVEVPNPAGRLRLGMFAEVRVRSPAATAAARVPRAALQNVDAATVVYIAVPGRPGAFVERQVQTGRQADGLVEITAGLEPGDRVVADGSFFLRAERERLGLAPAAQPAEAPLVRITPRGFEPAAVRLPAGGLARIRFLRTTDATCAKEVIFPSLGIERALPLETTVEVDLPAERPGEVTFTCGMKMYTGRIVAE